MWGSQNRLMLLGLSLLLWYLVPGTCYLVHSTAVLYLYYYITACTSTVLIGVQYCAGTTQHSGNVPVQHSSLRTINSFLRKRARNHGKGRCYISESCFFHVREIFPNYSSSEVYLSDVLPSVNFTYYSEIISQVLVVWKRQCFQASEICHRAAVRTVRAYECTR